MIDTKHVEVVETPAEGKVEIRSAVTGSLFARADGQGIYFFDRRTRTELMMSWKAFDRLRTDIAQGETVCVRIAG